MPENIHSSSQKLKSVKYIPPPLELPVYGVFSPRNITYLGRTNYISALEEKVYVFGIKKEDRMKNIFILGSTGFGKTKMLETMIRQDIENNYGLMLFDFNNDLFYLTLNCVSKRRISDVCILDFNDEKHLPSFNPFTFLPENLKSNFLEDFLNVFSFYFQNQWNEPLKYLLRMVLKTLLLLEKDNNLFFVQKLIHYEDYREKIANSLSNEQLKKFWLDDFPHFSQTFYRDAILPLDNFLDSIFTNQKLAQIFQSEGKINLEELVSQNKIILVNLPFVAFGNRLANFLKELILVRLKAAGYLRLNNSSLEPFYVYFDDLEEKTDQGSILSHLLAFSFKYLFSFTVTFQSLSQIPNYLSNYLFGNFCNLIIFGLNTLDATRIEKEFSSNVKAKDITTLSKQEFYIRMNINQHIYEPFSGETLMVSNESNQFAPANSLYEASLQFFL